MKYTRSSSGQLAPNKKRLAHLHTSYRLGEAVKIQFGPVKCKFLTPYPRPVYDAMGILVPGHIFIPSVKAGHWDGRHRCITKPGYFQTGLLPVIYTMLTRGINPLIDEDKKNHKVLPNPVENVEIIVPPEYTDLYYPGLTTYYQDNLELLQWLSPETGDFIFSTSLLKSWVAVKDTNPLAKKILQLGKHLHVEVPR